MSWTIVLWSAIGGICVAVSLVHFLIWLKRPAARVHLLFAIVSAAIAVTAVFEMLAMKAGSVEEFALIQRWGSAWVVVLMLSVVALVWVALDGARLWLAYTLCASLTLGLVVNFLSPVSISALEISSLLPVELWGGDIVVTPVIVTNPWIRLSDFNVLLYVAYILDASVTLWRRGEEAARRRALLIGGGILLATVVAGVHNALLHAGVIHAPYIITPSCLVLLLGLGYELGFEVFRSEELDRTVKERDVQLHESRLEAAERFRLVVEASPNAILIVSKTGGITLVNAEAEKIFGYSREEFRDLSVEQLIPERFRENHSTLREHFFDQPADREMSDRALWGQRKDGSEFPLEVGLKSIVTQGDAFVLATIADVTERKRTELEFVRQRNELAHMSRVMMLSELSGSLAHELNQPLTAILSNAQAAQRFLAADAPNPDELREILQDIVNDDRRAGEIIRGLRTMLKKGEMQYESVNVNDLVQDVLKLVRSDMLNSGVTLMVECSPALPRVTGDRVQLRQVLLNLVVNGCDAMKGSADPRRELVISTSLAADAGVQICVVDQGHGIPPGKLERVFDPFFTTKPGGLGLGLSVCRRIVAAHGGHLWAECNAVQGARFCLELPVKHEGAS